MAAQWPLSCITAAFSFATSAFAQAPVSDLTGYPSGLASIAVVAYYSIQSEKDDLPTRRRLAGMGIEHLARDQASGPKKLSARDLQIKSITINRRPGKYQHESWNWRVCGRKKGGLFYNNLHDSQIPLIDGNDILETCATAFADMPATLRSALSQSYGFGTAGHTVATLAAFCQIATAIPEAASLLKECAAARTDTDKLLDKYTELKDVMDRQSHLVTMPEIRDKTTLPELAGLFVGAHTWEGGGREVFVPCAVFVQTLGYFVGHSYGEILASAHRYLTDAPWAGSLQITFPQPLAVSTPEDVLVERAQRAVEAARFYKQDCDLRLWFHRFGDHLASLVAGCIIATLVSLGSTSGSWVAVTAAAVADPKPVAGYTCAAWGYPRGRRAHMEARGEPGEGIVCIKRDTFLKSFQPFVLHDISWQLVVGSLSVAILAFKFELREALGFGVFQPPAAWISRLCLSAGTLAVLIDLQIPYWAWQNGGGWCIIHALVMILLEIACLLPRFIWTDLSETNLVREFWITDGSAWIHCLLSALFSIHLSQTAEYPVTGWIWPSAWLTAFASCGAGYPRYLPQK